MSEKEAKITPEETKRLKGQEGGGEPSKPLEEDGVIEVDADIAGDATRFDHVPFGTDTRDGEEIPWDEEPSDEFVVRAYRKLAERKGWIPRDSNSEPGEPKTGGDNSGDGP